MRYVDTHCHLDDHHELDVRDQVERARRAGVTLMVTVGTDVHSSSQSIVTSRGYTGVYAAVGIHPNDADQATPPGLEAIDELAAEDLCVAVGETGLDRYRDETTPSQQRDSFRAHIEIAKRRGRALMIHCRDAWPECLDLLDEVGAPERVVMHCFSGDLEVTARCVRAGYYLSFAGNVTFKNAGELRASAAAAPRELLLTETDSPFLTPHPYRGKPNDPSYVPLTLAALAEVQGCASEALAEDVYANTLRAFAIHEHAGGPRAQE